jgi:hypothetical protein
MEYAIMIPLLVLQIFLFPLTASWLMNIWVGSRMDLALKESVSHLGSSILQLYSTMNHDTVSAGTTTYLPGLPPYIEDHYYTGTAALRNAGGSGVNSSRILDLSLSLAKTQTSETTSITLGANVIWNNSTFVSNSTNAVIIAQKFWNGTEYVVSLQFGN